MFKSKDNQKLAERSVSACCLCGQLMPILKYIIIQISDNYYYKIYCKNSISIATFVSDWWVIVYFFFFKAMAFWNRIPKPFQACCPVFSITILGFYNLIAHERFIFQLGFFHKMWTIHFIIIKQNCELPISNRYFNF